MANSSYLGGTVNVTSATLNNQAGVGANKPPLSGKMQPPNNMAPGKDSTAKVPVPGK